MTRPPISIRVMAPAKLTASLMPQAAMAPIATTTAVTRIGSGQGRKRPMYPALPRLIAAAATMAMATTSRPTPVAHRSELKAALT
jgi:hypothetical protein